MDNKWKNKNFISALNNSFNGIKYVFTTQRNLKIQIVISVIVILTSFLLKISFLEWAIITLVIFMVFFSELVNTVVETVVDMITIEYNEKAKIAKDVAAGAVTLISIASVIIGILIFLPKLWELFKLYIMQ